MKRSLLSVFFLALVLPTQVLPKSLQALQREWGEVLRIPLGTMNHNLYQAFLGKDGNFYLVEIVRTQGRLTGPGKLTVFDRMGRKVRQFTSENLRQLGIGVDVDGTIYLPSLDMVSDSMISRIRVLTPDFKPVRVIETPDTKTSRIFVSGDRLYLIAMRGKTKGTIDGNIVHVYSKDGRFITSFARWDESIPSIDYRINIALRSLLAIDEVRRELIFCRENKFSLEVYDMDGNLKGQIPLPFEKKAQAPDSSVYRVQGVHFLGNQLVVHAVRPDSKGQLRPCLEVFGVPTRDGVEEIRIPSEFGKLIGVDEQGNFYFFNKRLEMELIVARLIGSASSKRERLVVK